MKSFPFVFAIVLFAACNNAGNTPDGGPCSYKDSTYPARLIKVLPRTSEDYDAVFVLEGIKSFNGDDTVYYSMLNHQHAIYTREMPMDSLVKGKAYSYIVKNIISGHCTPHIELLMLTPCPGK